MRRFAFIAALLLGCSPDLTVPAGAEIQCSSDDACPAPLFCNEATQRCVEPGRDDLVAPTVRVVTDVVPAVGRRQSRFVLAIEPSEPLIGHAEVWFVAAGQPVNLETDDGATYAYVAGAADTDGEYPLLYRARDLIGNVAEGALGASLRFDFTPPEVVAGSPIVRLEPDLATNPLRTVSAAAPGTAVTLSFLTTELLQGEPNVRTVASSGLSWRKQTAQAVTFAFAVDWGGSTPTDGTYALQAELTDSAGNTTTSTLGVSLVVDATRPASPRVDRAEAVVMHRSPWGTQETSGAVQTTIVGVPGAAEPEATIMVLTDPGLFDMTGALASEASRGRVRSDGSFGGESSASGDLRISGDHPALFVVAVDSAGNVSDADGDATNGIQASRVRDVRWRATLLGKVAGSDAENPHEFQVRRMFSESLVQGSSRPEGHRLASVSPGSPPTSIGTGSWEHLGPSERIPRSNVFAGAHDPRRGRAVIFGHLPTASTRELGGTFWRTPVLNDPEGDGDPTPGFGQTMAYDARRGRVLLFGGAPPASDELWEIDGLSWRRRLPSDPEGDGNPAPRFLHGMAYDIERGTTLVHAGCTTPLNIDGCAERLDDLWSYDGSSWTELCTSAECRATVPRPRSGVAMAHDRARRVTLVFGGVAYRPCAPDEDDTNERCLSNALHAWDGRVWTRLCDGPPCSDAMPPARFAPLMAYDPDLERVVMHGGCDTLLPPDGICGNTLSDTWAFDGTSWTELRSMVAPEHAFGASRTGALMHSPRHGGVIFVGASSSNTVTWILRGEQWLPLVSVGDEPGGRCGADVVHDPARGEVVLFGGCASGCGFALEDACDAPLDDTHAWSPDGGWRRISTNTKPPARGMHALAWDPVRAHVVMTGGISRGRVADHWVLSGGDWSPIDINGTLPPISSHRMVWSDDELIIAGGYGLTSFATRRFDGAVWSDACAGGACGGVHAIDPSMTTLEDGRALLFGGARNDVGWLWDGTGWTRTSTVGPSFRRRAGMAYSAGRKAAIMYGGSAAPDRLIGPTAAFFCSPNSAYCEEVWEFDGADWTEVTPTDPEGDGNPGPRTNHVMAPIGDVDLFMFGGTRGGASASNDLWLYRTGADRRPGHVATFKFGAAGTQAKEQVMGITLTWCAEATGGVQLHGWLIDHWQTLPVTDAGNGCVVWEDRLDADRVHRFIGRDRQLPVAATPVDTNGDGAFSRITTRYVEATVRYRLPAR